MRLLLIAVVSRLPSCSWESGGAVTVAMNMTGFTSPCATDSNSAETLRSHIAERPAPWLWLRRLLAKVRVGYRNTFRQTWRRVGLKVLLKTS